MKIIIVRHGDPDYAHDTLTETGWQEARLAADRVKRINDREDIKEVFLSPLGRAQDTARPSLEAIGRTEDAVTYDWLQEFPYHILRPDKGGDKAIPWDWLPQDWTAYPEFYDPEKWKTHPLMVAGTEGSIGDHYDKICNQFDQLLLNYGYRRHDGPDGHYYEVLEPNTHTLMFFCHFGLECVLLSHLIYCSPMTLWHNFCVAPTGFTEVNTEERRKGIASWRIARMGDVSHLYVAGQEPSFSARFCECFDIEEQRHD